MKNQYFGDTRDLFKYDLIEHVLRRVDEFGRRLTYIPMLTPRDDTQHGKKLDYDGAVAGCRNEPLKRYLRECVQSGNRDIRLIVLYFEKVGVETHLYRGDEFFAHDDRNAYFGGIEHGLLTRALVFLDPDTGLEIEESTEAHLLYSGVKGLYDRTSEDAALMVFQYISRYIPKVERPAYVARRSQELAECAGGVSVYVSDHDELAFLFLARDEGMANRLRDALLEYVRLYPGLTVGP